MELYYKEQQMSLALTYGKRKTVGISIDCYGNITIKAPKGMDEETILKLLETKAKWIHEKSTEMKAMSAGAKEKVYDHGETFLYLGEQYPIEIIEDSTIEKNHVKFHGDHMKVYVKQHDDQSVQEALKRFYGQECKRIVEQRIKVYLKNVSVKPKNIEIVESRNHWGSCSSERKLTFNWKLTMAPMNVIDYVVVHELCHLEHMNHSRSFWRLVGKIMPDYEEQKLWLSKSSWQMVV